MWIEKRDDDDCKGLGEEIDGGYKMHNYKETNGRASENEVHSMNMYGVKHFAPTVLEKQTLDMTFSKTLFDTLSSRYSTSQHDSLQL